MDKHIGLKIPFWLAWIPVLSALLVAVTGSVYFTSTQQQQQKTNHDLLTSVARMTAAQIQQGRSELRNDVNELVTAPGLVSSYQEYLQTKSPESKKQVMIRMVKRQANWQMTGITLVDMKGAFQIGTSNKYTSIPSSIKALISTAIKRSDIIIHDMETLPLDSTKRLCVVAPIIASDQKTKLGAALCFLVTSRRFYPILHGWPNPSVNAETLLVIKQGNNALVLHPTRFRKSSTMSDAWPITNDSVPSTKAVNGYEGVITGTDYRNHSVISVTIKLPDTNWYVVSKIDRAETLGLINTNKALIVTVISGLLFLVIAITVSGWHFLKRDQYKQAYEAELQKQALALHYQALIQNAVDIILLADTDNRIIDANELAVQTYGYTRDQLLSMSVFDLVSSEHKDASHDRAVQLKTVDILTFNSQHIKENGELMYVEGRARTIETAGKHYIQLIMRDASEKMNEQMRLERNERLFTGFMNHLPGMGYVINQHGEFEFINKALAEFIGVDFADPSTWNRQNEHPLLPFLHCDENQKQELNRYHNATTEIQLSEASRVKHYRLDRFLYRQPDGYDWMGGVIVDITQSKQAEHELHRLNLIYATLGQINDVIVKATDTADLYQKVCDVAVDYGKSSLAWIGSYNEQNSTLSSLAWCGSPQKYVNIVTAPASGMMGDIDPVFAAIAQKKSVTNNNIAADAYSPGEMLLQTQDIHSAAAVPIMDGSDVIGVLAIYQQEADFFREQELQLLDKIGMNLTYGIISIRKRDQQRQLEEIVVKSPAVAFRWMNTPGWPVQYVSDNIAQLGIEARWFTEQQNPYTSIIHPDDLAAVEEAFGQYLTNPESIYVNVYRIVDQSGETRWVEERSWIVDDLSGSRQYVMGIVMDITRQKLVEQDQMESEQRYHAVFDNLHTVMLVVDPANGAIIDANPAAVEFYGWPKEQLLTMVMSSINTLPASQQAEAMAKVMAHTQNHFRFMHRRANGRTCDVEVYSTSITIKGKPLLYSIIHDVTDRVTAEEMRLREEQRQVQSSKMETIGQLSSGIAHDFNNLLTVITGFVDIMMEETSADSTLFSEMTEVKNASEKAAALTKQLLAFSRKQTMEKKPVDVNALIAANNKMITRLIGEDIKVEMTLAPGVLMASVDEGQLNQVMLNMATNARDAMPNGGKIRIVTDVINITKDDISFGADASEGKYIKITLADTGAGMDEATSSRIFEPFYTTKEAGKGTVLGLSTCYGIMKQHEGWISVASTKGAGTEFYLYLPALDTPQDTSSRVTTAVTLPQGGGHTVLLVEDEMAVRRMSIKVLERFGYLVTPASDGVEALALYKDEPSRFDLVLSDVVMPNMDGLTLINHIQELNPSQKIILNSGYTDDKVDWNNIENRNITFLHKPFTVEKLITTVHQVINTA